MRPTSSPWHAAFRAVGWYVLGALVPAAIAVASFEEFRQVEWPATALGWFFRVFAHLGWTLLTTLTPATYFLLVLLLFGARRQPLARRPVLLAGAVCAGAVALALPWLESDELVLVACLLAAASAATLLIFAPAAAVPLVRRWRSTGVESLGSRRGSQPFAFGLTAAVGAFAAGALHAWPWPEDEGGLNGPELLLVLPILVGFVAMVFGAVYALGAGLGAIFRRGAAPASPYGLIAGCVSGLLAALVGSDYLSIQNTSLLCSFAAGMFGTLAGSRETAWTARHPRTGARRA